VFDGEGGNHKKNKSQKKIIKSKKS
jgi:hypothetical protein